MILNKIKNILEIFYPIVFFYIIIHLGWWKEYNNNILNTKILIGIIFVINIMHFFILFDKKLERDYKSMIFLSSLILFIPIVLFLTKIYFIKNKNYSIIRISSIISLVIYILIRITYSMKKIYMKIHNPIFIFIMSFIFLVFLGSILLMLPASTVRNISFIDALFTSTSAVCVTGLIVLDTSKDFTFIGKIILLILIELGGLGILTITSFLNYFFRNGFSFKEAVFVSSFLNTKTTNNVLLFAVKVVFFTIIIELIGSLLIYLCIKNSGINISMIEYNNLLFFSIFHSISAFCNSGFSILSQGFYSKFIRFNYCFQLIIAFLIILGGIGFNILFNFFHLFWLNIKKCFYKIFKHEYIRPPINIVTLNTRIVIITTFFLIIFGTIFYYISEYYFSLEKHSSLYGKWIISFFSSVTARTAGFNVLNMNNLNPITILVTIFLMWIGASPASTGGGIKTSTFALAIMNIISLYKGKDRLEIRRREISRESIRIAFSIIMLSLIIIYTSVLFILFFDPEKNILSIFFEVFSAFSTTGLSLGITSSLSTVSKLILILLMLLGRIGIFNIVISFLRKNKINFNNYYKLPEENILI
ncbi:TrkH family potassium uptake protein [Blattabacterium cuenoti]|uniref:TrkH family potassium uptake protein n=1 Tax=Blattabacterium cuenoti TaxID=1653831 RepID=UPI00163BC7C0|nr:potassium transporter TrkG [Blattabacterium cuenoti]